MFSQSMPFHFWFPFLPNTLLHLSSFQNTSPSQTSLHISSTTSECRSAPFVPHAPFPANARPALLLLKIRRPHSCRAASNRRHPHSWPISAPAYPLEPVARGAHGVPSVVQKRRSISTSIQGAQLRTSALRIQQ